MVDTCFLCAVGSVSTVASPAATTSDEFGTCCNCGVHACPRHGEPSPQFFWCSNCITGNSARQVSGPPGGGTGDRPDDDVQSASARWQRWISRVDRFGREWFVASAPGTAIGGSRVFDARLISPMREGLRAWADNPRESFLDFLERQLTERLGEDPSLAADALGLSPARFDAIRSLPRITDAAQHPDPVVELAMARTGLIFEELRTADQGERGPVSDQRAAYALAVLSAALAGRDSSLHRSVVEVPGALSMPPFVVLLGLLLEAGRGGTPVAERESMVLTT